MNNDIPIPGQKVVGPYLAELRDQVARMLHVRHNRFPGAQPVSFTQDNVNDLLNRNFFVCEKTDGLRIMLFATYNRQEKKYESFLINRSHDFYYTKVLLPIPAEPGVKPYTKFHHGTLIDGELIIDTESDGRRVMRYLVFDCLTCRDKVLVSRPFRIRLGHFHDFVLKPLKRMAAERPDLMQRIPFQIEAKQMQLSYHVKEIFAEQPLLKHKSDGLIFTSSEEPYTLGTDQNILKWKPANENTVDFLLRHNAHGEMELHLWHGGNRHEFHCLLHEQDPNKLSLLRGANGKVIECHYDPDSNPPWQFMRFRSDKNTANHYSVFEKIMQSIRDGVTQAELESIAPQARSNWKFREANPHLAPAPAPRPPAVATPVLAPSPPHATTASVPPSIPRTLSAPASVSPHPSVGSASSHHARDFSPPHAPTAYHSSPGRGGLPDWDARPQWDTHAPAAPQTVRVPAWDAPGTGGGLDSALDRDRDTYRPVSPGRDVYGQDLQSGVAGFEFAEASRYAHEERIQDWRGNVQTSRRPDSRDGHRGVLEFAHASDRGEGTGAQGWVPDWELPEEMQRNGRRTTEDVFVEEDEEAISEASSEDGMDEGDRDGYGQGFEDADPALVDKYAHDWDVELDQDEYGEAEGTGAFGIASRATKGSFGTSAFSALVLGSGMGDPVDEKRPKTGDDEPATVAASAAPLGASTSTGSSQSTLPVGEPMDDDDDVYDDDEDGYVYRPSSP